MSKKGRRPDSVKSPYASHPGYDPDWEPQTEVVPRRVRSAAEGNYQRNRGTMQMYMDFSNNANRTYESPRPIPKARSDAAREILSRSVNGSIGSLLGQSSQCCEYDDEYTPPPRVKGAARDILEKNRGSMDDMIGSGSVYCPAPAPVRGGVPRIKPQAFNNASMHRGSQVDVLFHNYGKMGPDPSKPPRVRLGACDNEIRGRGLVGKLFQGDVPGDPVPHPRVRGVAEDNLRRSQGALHQLLANKGYTPKGYSYYNALAGDIASARPSSAVLY